MIFNINEVNKAVEAILQEIEVDSEIDFLGIIKDTCKEKDIDLDDLTEFIFDNQELKKKFAKILAKQNYDRGLYQEDILDGLY